MLLTDSDILKLLNREIVIEPFEDRCLTPVGYNFRVGDFVYSLGRGLLKPNRAGRYTITSSETVLILTKEFLWVSDRIGGTFHSKVKLVSRGFSHISTTLDPAWSGPLLIAITNMTQADQFIATGEAFVTLLFYRTRSRATRIQNNPPARRDILLQLLGQPRNDVKQALITHQRQLLEKVSQIILDVDAQHEFHIRVRQANEKGIARVLNATNTRLKSGGIHRAVVAAHFFLLTVIILLPLCFDRWIKTLFPRALSNVSIDSQFFAGVLGAAIIVTISLLNQMKKID